MALAELGASGRFFRLSNPYGTASATSLGLKYLLDSLGTFDSPEAIDRLIAWHAVVLDQGFLACDQIIRGVKDVPLPMFQPNLRDVPWTALCIAEGSRCLFIRESLRRIDRRSGTTPAESEPWEATPPDLLRGLDTGDDGEDGEMPPRVEDRLPPAAGSGAFPGPRPAAELRNSDFPSRL